ncbi:hypothetical protein jhhlp_005576 [Lomentospora prolificans]|uniref:CMP/dCMP-type deaminase domain-containing protein n=1 Tax=Lomentospora prolificans TaxID=41688 RepID=A0A2N3N3I1_9PEZI|nr:hypothetical protein jhhlp_005576 [Lomentospora prolificans]
MEAPAVTADTIGSTGFDKPLPGPVQIHPNPLIEGIDVTSLQKGVLIPLKTTLEVRQDHDNVQAYITRAPTKCANEVMSLLRKLLPETKVKSMPHLRRVAKPGDLPAHLKTELMNMDAVGKQIHTGKSAWIYIMLGEVKYIDREELCAGLEGVEGLEGFFLASIAVPATPPTSQITAAMWSSQYWPTVYRKNNPLGPHPSLISRSTLEIKDDTALWMSVAYRVARRAKEEGIGEAMAAVIVQREEGQARIMAVAADARWAGESVRSFTSTGNPMAHCALRAVSMVAQKLVRHERRAAGQPLEDPLLDFEPFQDRPLLDEERVIFEEEHPNPDGYLCHGLELYLTHEPCVQCGMGILHSRMGKVVFAHRQSLTGGFCSEPRGHDMPDSQAGSAGRGLGIFWRRELNWSLLAWEWEPSSELGSLPGVHPHVHV